MPKLDFKKKPFTFGKKMSEEDKQFVSETFLPIKKKDEKPKKKDKLDLNGDGKVDKKDASIASKVLNRFKSKKKKGGKK